MSVFESTALEFFGYLDGGLGYKVADRSPGLLTYRGNGMVVVIRHDFRRSYELTIDLSEEGQSSPPFNFGEALRSCDAPTDLPSSYQVSDENKLPSFIGKLAKNLQTYCSKLLLGDSQALQRLQKLRESECETFEKERELRYARNDANQAWAAGNYDQVVNALKPHENLLNNSEKMKLEIARKKLSGPTEDVSS